jgi:ATP-dependent 26S proteasome regulatory subunit
MNATGAVGQWYLASTSDVQLLDRFGRDVYEHFHPPGKLIIQVHGGRDISLEPADDETIFLPEPLRHDIEQQVYSFFENAEQYRHLRVRRRRGFLFVGSPATGKTMMVRHLVRQCYRRYHIAFFMLNIARETTDANVTTLFHEAQHKAPAMVILEDLDSLTTECRVSRAHLLAELDGLDAREGVLVIGTTNNPRQIDPALAHRPSRFDRVWHFPLPDVEMRRRYLQWAFDGLEAKAIAAVAERTNKWSFAYLNELRTTTAILAMDRGSPSLTEEDLSNALNLLGPQFREGRKNHPIDDTGDFTGFGSD